MPKAVQPRSSAASVTGRSKKPAKRAGAPVPAGMPDVQGSSDQRRIAIDKVGVKNVVYPMRLRQKDGGEQATIATVNMFVSLPHYQKGTHMSRFLEVLNGYTSAIRPDEIPAIAEAIRRRLDAADAHFSVAFTYFVNKKAPVTGMAGLMNYQVSFDCAVKPGVSDFVMSVKAPATSLCPCSKEISKYGAHNQRCEIEAKVRFKGMLWVEDLVSTLEHAASMELFAVLKRPDEKYVTEKAYENPKFVEDIVRDLALALERDKRVSWYSINSENFESIHSHNAYAEITRDKR